jgi:hypothetical protein
MNALFRWVPGEGFDEAACARLVSAFPKPAEPMGEAWFMSRKRRTFHNLTGDLDAVSVADLQEALREIISGNYCFGPYLEWTEWFHYLLGQLVPRGHEHYVRYLLESLIGGFVTQYPDGVLAEPYLGFRDDVLDTLGRCMMDRACWSGGNIVIGKILHSGIWPNGRWGWFNASGDFSASMFFCLKYLPADQIDGWLSSVLSISCPHWRAQLVAWFVGAHDVLTGDVKQPAAFSPWPNSAGKPEIDWEDSHSLHGDYNGDHGKGVEPTHFLPETNRRQALAIMRTSMTQGVIMEWLISMQDYDYLETELLYLPQQLLDLYV